MNRRNFIRNTSALTAAGLMTSENLFAQPPLINNIGIQMFSVPKASERDLPYVLAMLSGMGYREVELYGPYPFSTEAAKARWASVTPALGFSGSGYFGRSGEEMAAQLKTHSLTAPSMHTDLDTLQNNMSQLAEAAHKTGTEYVVLPAIPDEKRKTLDDYKKIASDFNAIGESAKKQGVKFAYHNHGYGLTAMDGQIPLRLILDGTDPELVFFEMDIFWTVAGGADPVELFQSYKNRYHLMHIKDMSKQARFSGDGGDSKQWIELFPLMTTAGSGVLDLKKIIKVAKDNGVKHFIVEQDMVANPQTALKKSIQFLEKLK
ncbi:sugar phosphate isomerase/epimerase [Pollutibacter soli]|uniref:sugar phosphate isomerase/epimerase family protein n=1 Tax=Pollutibacter soli TaxID=3034157 RepID=UPI003013DEC3